MFQRYADSCFRLLGMFLRSDVTMNTLCNVIPVPIMLLECIQHKKGHHILQSRVEQINSSLLSFLSVRGQYNELY